MKTPETSSLFEKHINDESGVEYYILSKRIAAFQQGFYFVNNSMTNDGRYLWFYCAFPPIGNSDLRSLGVIDFEKDEVHYLPDTIFNSASPCIDDETGDIYFTWENKIFKRTPDPLIPTEQIGEVNFKGRCTSLATHLTFSPDQSEFFLDTRSGNDTFICGSYNIKSGEFTKWVESDLLYNHAQFHPQNKDMVLLAHDHWYDYISGEKKSIPYDKNNVYQRLWTATRDGELKNYPPLYNYATHEWWGPKGDKFYYVNSHGIMSHNIKTGEDEEIHSCNPWHAHCTKDEELFIYDVVLYERFKVWYRGCPSAVHFYNSRTGKDIPIVTRNPEIGTPENPCNYHIDPHPRFTADEKYVVFTATVNNTVDLAVAPMQQMLDLTE